MAITQPVSAAVSLLLLAATVAAAPPCPYLTHRVSKSEPGSERKDITWISKVPMDVVVYWINFEGQEQSAMVLPAMSSNTGGTFSGHSFRVRTYAGTLLKEHTVAGGSVVEKLTVEVCGNVEAESDVLYPPERKAEFEALAHPADRPCEGPRNTWSCVRYSDEEEWRTRSKEEFGFLPNEVEPSRVGLTTDTGYSEHISRVPKVSAFGPGYLKMTIPDSLRIPLLNWYNETKDKMTPHEPIPGGYTNVDKIPMNRLNLDRYSGIRNDLIREMQQVLQWWCDMRLRHTSTYGVRIYRRGSMLINHVDRMDTHLASAVIQVDQEVDEDGGWPLEILLPNKKYAEVYLQPGEMVLYEGAWLRHGRPMRFKGESFANIFTHFAPHDWSGPGRDAWDNSKPLPQVYHGYMPGRCNTLADDASKGIGCVSTPFMDGVDNRGAYDEEL